MKCADKISSWEQLPAWREKLRAEGRKLVVTNGCFDLLHRGHVTYLECARALGDALLVGVNSDASVRELKGPDRPVNSESDRAFVLAALESVDGVCVFGIVQRFRHFRPRHSFGIRPVTPRSAAPCALRNRHGR